MHEALMNKYSRFRQRTAFGEMLQGLRLHQRFGAMTSVRRFLESVSSCAVQFLTIPKRVAQLERTGVFTNLELPFLTSVVKWPFLSKTSRRAEAGGSQVGAQSPQGSGLPVPSPNMIQEVIVRGQSGRELLPSKPFPRRLAEVDSSQWEVDPAEAKDANRPAFGFPSSQQVQAWQAEAYVKDVSDKVGARDGLEFFPWFLTAINQIRSWINAGIGFVPHGEPVLERRSARDWKFSDSAMWEQVPRTLLRGRLQNRLDGEDQSSSGNERSRTSSYWDVGGSTWPFDMWQSQGIPLTILQRDRLEPIFPHLNLEDIRVHSDEHADRAVRSLGAEAFSIGTNIFVAAQRFHPWTPRGLALLGHELAHTSQISGGASFVTPTQRASLEQSAESIEGAILRSFSTSGRQNHELEDVPTVPNSPIYTPLRLEPARPPHAEAGAVIPTGRTTVRNVAPAWSGRIDTPHSPLTAQEHRSVAAGSPSVSGGSSDDQENLARLLYRNIERTMQVERERRGIDRWVN